MGYTKLIDADALKAKYEQMLLEIGDGYHKETLQDVLFELEYAPTVSPDEVRGVVHCRNCYHAEPRNPVGKKTKIFCRLFIAGMREDDFCSYGEFLTNSGAKMEVSKDA